MVMCVRIKFGKFSTSHQMDPKFIAGTFRAALRFIGIFHTFSHIGSGSNHAHPFQAHRTVNSLFVLCFRVHRICCGESSAGDKSIRLVSNYIYYRGARRRKKQAHNTENDCSMELGCGWRLLIEWYARCFWLKCSQLSVCQAFGVILSTKIASIVIWWWTHLRY